VQWTSQNGLVGSMVVSHARPHGSRPAKARHPMLPRPIAFSVVANAATAAPKGGARGVHNGRLPNNHVPLDVQQLDPITGSLFQQHQLSFDTSPSWTEPKTSIRSRVHFPDPFPLPITERLTNHHREWDPMCEEASLICPSISATSSDKLSEAREGVATSNLPGDLTRSSVDAITLSACTTGPCNVPTMSSQAAMPLDLLQAPPKLELVHFVRP
jgi:hypothetical protein